MFPTREGAFHDTDNYRKRVLHSLAERLEFRNMPMPHPSRLTVADGELMITPDVSVTLKGATNPPLERAPLRMLNRLETQPLVQLDKNLQSPGA
jgi:hypothetical protein